MPAWQVEATLRAAQAQLVQAAAALPDRDPVLWPPDTARQLGEVLRAGRQLFVQVVAL